MHVLQKAFYDQRMAQYKAQINSFDAKIQQTQATIEKFQADEDRYQATLETSPSKSKTCGRFSPSMAPGHCLTN